ncbi:MAG: hypothetical protein WCO77_00510 [bacterium]
MRKSKFILLSLVISMAVYFTLTWPLGALFHEGIPSSNRPEQGGARYMIPGDHLQFVFQLWMLADSFKGGAPLFSHVYEFNQGDDQALYNPGSYYFPFGLLFSAGHALGGTVVGWNLMLCLTVWWIYLSTWFLIRRFTRSRLTAAVAALPSILLPYFYVSLLGGSPTGMGMLWVPLIFLGVDVAIRDRRIWGGVLAGILLYISAWVDLHVFFFVFLATPVWMLMSLALKKAETKGFGRIKWRELIRPVSPVVIGMGLAYLQTSLIKASLDDTLQSQGRSIKESLGYALRAPGWFDPALDNRYNIIYIGIWVAVVLATGLLFLVVDAWRNRPHARGRLALFGMILGAIFGIAILAVGPNTPFDSHHTLWTTLRALIPPYKMIRQPAKIYCLLTPFLGIALAIVIDRFNQAILRRGWVVVVSLVIAAGCLVDYGRRLDPTICLLDYKQGAYRAVARDAAQSGRENRALALPLWPGDSHWNSITEYYATLYRTKMLNGYSPSVSRQYFTNVFERFEALNMGVVSEDTLDGLLAMKIGYLIVHEDAFPKKVSPFPASQTLRELMRHPRLQFLAQDKAVWSFKIATNHEPSTISHEPSSTLFTAWQWDACNVARGSATVTREGSNSFVRLTAPEGRVEIGDRTLYPVEGLRYVASVRGTGVLGGSFGTGLPGDSFRVAVTSGSEWVWAEIPVPVMPPNRQTWLEPVFTNIAGTVDISMITLLAGPWQWQKAGETQAVSAAAFFRSGYSDRASGDIRLEADRVQAGVAFYAPVVPVLPGRYRIALNYTADCPDGTKLGEWSVSRSDGQSRHTGTVVSGQPATVDYPHTAPCPLSLEFQYNRQADMVIRSVSFTRVE